LGVGAVGAFDFVGVAGEEGGVAGGAGFAEGGCPGVPVVGVGGFEPGGWCVVVAFVGVASVAGPGAGDGVVAEAVGFPEVGEEGVVVGGGDDEGVAVGVEVGAGEHGLVFEWCVVGCVHGGFLCGGEG